jgi:probable rRNA maturation factor
MSTVSVDLVITGRMPKSLTVGAIRRVINNSLDALKLRSAVLGLAFLTEAKMLEKNNKYRKIKKPTDVLSFAYPAPKGSRCLNGDILICPVYAAKQAKQASVPINQELKRLLVHGLLHLAGYDHATAKDEKKMFRLQEKLVKM